MKFFVNAKLREEFSQHVGQSPGVLSLVRPWIVIRQSNGALLMVRWCGQKFMLIGPKARFASGVMSENEYFSLIKKLGPVPDLWPETGLKIRK